MKLSLIRQIKQHLSPPWILVLAYLSLCLLTFINWAIHGWFPPTGDEPAYLLLADSIARDSSFDMSLALERELQTGVIHPGPTSIEQGMGFFHIFSNKNGLFSAHSIGLSLLLAVPYLLGGKFAAKLALVLLSSAIILFGWLLSGRFTNNRKIRFMSVAAAAIALPFIPASNQIYPDLVAGVFSLSVITVIMLEDAAPKNIKLFELGAGLAIAFLPWLHIKFIICSAILAVGLFWKIFSKTKSITHATDPLFPLAASILLLAAYNSHAFGTIGGVYSTGAVRTTEISKHSLMVLLGLHIDRFQGIFIQNPAFLAGLVFVVPFLIRERIVGVLVVLLYGAFVVPNALHPNWYGGDSFAGRFMWSGAVVVLPIVIYGLTKCFEHLSKQAIYLFSGLCLIQGYLYGLYTFHRFDFYNKAYSFGIDYANLPWPSEYPSFYPVFDDFLPMLYDSRWAYTYAPNIIFLIVCVGLFCLGVASINRISRLRQKAFLYALSSIFAIILCGVISKPTNSPKVFPAYTLPHQVGVIENGSRTASEAVEDPPGFLNYGPYISLKSGDYIFKLEYETAEKAGEEVGWIDVFLPDFGESIIREKIISSSEKSFVETKFSLSERLSQSSVELRTYYGGKGTLTAHNIYLNKL